MGAERPVQSVTVGETATANHTSSITIHLSGVSIRSVPARDYIEVDVFTDLPVPEYPRPDPGPKWVRIQNSKKMSQVWVRSDMIITGLCNFNWTSQEGSIQI